MTIFRRVKQQHFTTISNDVIDDARMSAKALGILTYLLSKPDNWTARQEDIVNHFKDGSTSIKSGLKELKDLGYIDGTDLGLLQPDQFTEH